MVIFILLQSHFPFNSFFLYNSQLETQILRNLHTFSTIIQNANFLSQLSQAYPFRSNIQNSLHFHPVHNQNLILNPITSYLFSNQQKNLTNLPTQNKLQKPIILNEVTEEKQEKTSNLKQQQGQNLEGNFVFKNCKKRKGKKQIKIQKKQKQTKRNALQNSKRNIIPNQIHQILSILFKKNKSSHIVGKLIKRYSEQKKSQEFSVQRFYLYQSLLKEKISHYANEKSLKHLISPLDSENVIYSREQQQLYMKIGLILVFYFIRKEADITILNSQRIKSSNRLQHMKAKRYLQSFLKELIQQKNELQFQTNQQ